MTAQPTPTATAQSEATIALERRQGVHLPRLDTPTLDCTNSELSCEIDAPVTVEAVHPYWCDECGAKAPFTIRGSAIDHDQDCCRYGEDAMQVYANAVEYVRATGKAIP